MKSNFVSRTIALTTLLLMFGSGARADPYWGYIYQGVEVTAAGTAEHAISFGQNIARLDAALVQTGTVPPGSWRAPLHIYALPTDVFKKIWGGSDIAVFANAGPENDIMVDSGAPHGSDDAYSGAYFGYTAALLTTQAVARHPYWYRNGIASVFSDSVIRGNHVTLGSYIPNEMRELHSGPLIPMRTLLRLHDDDPQLEQMRYLYQSQCWFFMHQILVEGAYRTEVARYLQMMSEGQSEEQSFSASFHTPYEELDKFMRGALHNGTIKEVTITLPALPNTISPQLLSAAEVNARLAELEIRHHHEVPDAIQRARDALAAEPSNERAWRALSHGQILAGQFGDALQSVEQMSAQPSRSAAGYRDSAWVLAAIGNAVSEHRAEVGAEATALLKRARSNYEKALALNMDDALTYEDLAQLIIDQKDKPAALDLKPHMEQAMYRHPRDAELASALAELCATAGDIDCAFTFAIAWQKYAMTDSEQSRASTYVSRLKANIEQHPQTNSAQPQ